MSHRESSQFSHRKKGLCVGPGCSVRMPKSGPKWCPGCWPREAARKLAQDRRAGRSPKPKPLDNPNRTR